MDAVKGRQVAFLGLPFDDLTLAEACERVLGRGDGLPFAYIVTPNADHLARLRRRPELRALYDGAWLRLLDSRTLANFADRLGLQRPAVVTGADLTAALLPRLGGATVAVIGLDIGDLAALRRRFPDVDWRHHAPPMGLADDPAGFAAAVAFGVAARAWVTFICLGAPLQERLAAAIAGRPGAVGLGLCVGAALRFAAGRDRRAPAWMRRAGLEWLHRLGREPGRLARRYLWDDPPVLAALAAAAWRERLRKEEPPAAGAGRPRTP